MKVLVTGGAGYIGSHTVVELLASGMEPVIVDNFSNCRPEVLRRLEDITGHKIECFDVDVTDANALRRVFEQVLPDAVIHFAALKAVGESVREPLEYYRNNVGATVTLALVMKEFKTRQIVFSSSATVYGDPKSIPVDEQASLTATNPYGQTKLMGEQILRDTAAADPLLKVTLLRYFNPVGAHSSGAIGEDPLGVPNNIMPMIAQVASGRRKQLEIYGNDYPTPDGTGVRDYIHVVDLAKAHVQALKHQDSVAGVKTYNLGAGRGYSVLELVQAFETASGRTVAYEIAPRRAGDIAACYADPTLAENELEWKATKTLEEMCADAWRWQSANPKGYDKISAKK